MTRSLRYSVGDHLRAFPQIATQQTKDFLGCLYEDKLWERTLENCDTLVAIARHLHVPNTGAGSWMRKDHATLNGFLKELDAAIGRYLAIKALGIASGVEVTLEECDQPRKVVVIERNFHIRVEGRKGSFSPLGCVVWNRA